jgi:acyl dehydratase
MGRNGRLLGPRQAGRLALFAFSILASNGPAKRESESMAEARGSEEIGRRVVGHDSIKQFGELTGDHSDIHFDPEAGRRAGYGGPIAHGLLTACWAVGALTQHEPERLAIGEPDAVQSAFNLRLSNVVRAGDHFAARVLESDGADTDSGGNPRERTTRFETLNQDAAQTCSGDLTISRRERLQTEAAPDPWELGPWEGATSDRVLYAEDLVAFGPRGRSSERTIPHNQVIAFAEHVGELNPIYLDRDFAKRSAFGEPIVPPMFSFALAFSDFLHDLLSAEMPSDGFAGHIGDRWRLFDPIYPGDTLNTRHRPLSSSPSKSRPDMAIVRFGLQIVNHLDRVVQEGETVMMIPARPPNP